MTATRGRAFVFGDDVDTDALAPGAWIKFGVEEIARHCLEALDPSFAARVRPGDVVVAGRNFGAGSSREQAAAALRHLGVAAVVARSFAGIFHRNAINLGLPVLECERADAVRAGDALAVDIAGACVELPERGLVLACTPVPDHLKAILDAGGLLPWLERRIAAQRNPNPP
ncbi:MAG: 3-isopropylmalate dehydratase [Betaproteobacteria bacterium]|nr:3-isopropylmalate dehydratase [Betaproteobacteria bacterium]